MDNRSSIRHESADVPEEMTTVFIELRDKSFVETELVNICSHGIKTRILEACSVPLVPQKNDILKVVFKCHEMMFTGMCMYSMDNDDHSATLGIYFIIPSEQNTLHDVLDGLPPADDFRVKSDCLTDEHFVRHEWEELVDVMCHSENPELREKGLREFDKIGTSDRSWLQNCTL